MRLRHRALIGLLAVALPASAALAAQTRTLATGWTRISGPTQAGVQLGLARTADGVLHVISNHGATPTSISETRISPAGKPVGTSTVASGFDGNLGLALLSMPDNTLRLFAAGAVSPGSPAEGINTFTAPASGGTWSLQTGVFWGGAVAESSGIIGATLTKDGQPVTAWRGFAAEGLPPASIPQNAYVADQTGSHLATDAATGAVILSGVTNAGKGGVFVQQILPSPAAAVVLPLPFGQNDFYSSLSGRIGAPGVFVAYTDTKAARLYRYGGGSKTLAKGAFTSAAVCSGPEGRLWVAWGSAASGLFVTRSNKAVGGFEQVQKLKAPSSNGMAFIQCEGSAGPLDLFADGGAGGTGFFHTYLLARASLRALVSHPKKGPAKMTLRLTDAGDPVAGAAISIGGKKLTTAANGTATVQLPPGKYTATATAPGYAPATVSARV